MKYFLFGLMATLFFISCKNEGLKPTNCRSGRCTYTFDKDQQIDLDSSSGSLAVSVEDGDMLVFEYLYVKNDKERIADDEYSEKIRFEIPSDSEGFSYTDSELKDTKLVFTPACFCPVESILISSGSLQGEKTSDDEWEVSMNVTFTWLSEESREIEATFQAQPE
jgi:hypothetical protein